MTSPQPTGFCSACTAIFATDSSSQQNYYAHYKNGLTGLKEAISTGCDLCAKLWASLTQQQQDAVEASNHNPDQLQENKTTYYCIEKDERTEKDDGPKKFHLLYRWPIGGLGQAPGSRPVTSLLKRFKIISSVPFGNEFGNEFTPCSYTAQNASNYVAVEPRNLTGMSSSQRTWSTAETTLAKFWINLCVEGHPSCPRAQTSFRPSRLIDVGTDGHPTVRLCERTEVAADAKYTTLSYCWGTAPCFMLKEANVGEMKNSFFYDILPKTIQDAIIVTRDLDIKYLWVDSLCIIQDSVDDWARECEVMGDIYSGSYCNIAATGASSNKEGCIFERDPASVLSGGVHSAISVSPIHELAQHPGSQVRPWQPAIPPGMYAIVNDEQVWTVEFAEAPLCQRAWAVQERLLAPRNLHFGKRQLGFECAEWIACETFPGGFPGNLVSTAHWKQRCSVRRAMIDRKDLDLGAIDSMRMAWAFLVTEFSKGQLTRPQDKLAAVFGVATKMREAIDSPYVAGLWVNQLLEQLLWRVEASAEHLKPRSAVYQAPSWSWAAVNHPVREIFAFGIFRHNPHFLTEIIAIEGQNLDMVINPIPAGIRLRGRLFDVSLHKRNTPPRSSQDLFSFQSSEFEEADITVFPDHLPSTMHVACLPVLTSSYPGYFYIEGLLIEKTDIEGRYRRTGKFNVVQVLARSPNIYEKDFESTSSFVIE